MKLLGTILCLLALFVVANGETIEDLYRQCNYIRHDIAFTLAGVTEIKLMQKNKNYTFDRTDAEGDKSHFLLKMEGSGIELGAATLMQRDQSNETLSVDIVFTNMSYNPDLERMYTYTEIEVTELACRFDRDLFSYVHYNSLNQPEEIKFNESATGCGVRIHSTAPTGYYEVFVKNPYTLENVYASHFTLISDKSTITKENITVQMPIPMKIKNDYFSFRISYSSEWETIKQIYVLREISDPPLIITSEISHEGNYFEYKLNGNIREYVVYFRLKQMDIMYYVERILFDDYYLFSFGEYEYSFGQYFSIEKQFALSQAKEDIELVFSSREQCETYKTNIYFKDLLDPEATIKEAKCLESVGHILKCKLDTTIPSVYALGIGQGMVSSQTVNLFTYLVESDDGVVNICVIETIDKESAKFKASVYLPEYNYDEDLKIEGTMVSKETRPGYCSVTKGNNTYNHYILSCDANDLNDGLFGLQIGIGYGDSLQQFTVNNVNINVKGKYLIEKIKEGELILTSQDQELTITFSKEVPQGFMKEIQLRQNDKVSKIFTAKEDKTSKTKVYPIYDLIDSGFTLGNAHIYYKYPCSDSEDFEDSTSDIRIAPNMIKSIEPNFVNIIGNTKAVVTFYYPLGGIDAILEFETGSALVEFNLSNECCDYFEVYGNMFNVSESYYVTLKFPSINEVFTWKEDFYVFENGIELQEDKDYVRPGDLQVDTHIELKYPVLLDQVYKIEFIDAKKERTQVSAEHISVDFKTKSIIITNYPVQLNKLEEVKFVIYDVIAPETEIIYTIYCGDEINLRVANLQLTCQNPAHEGTNYVYFNFTADGLYNYPYNVDNLQTIVFNRIDRSTGNKTEFVFCHYKIYEEQTYHGISCNKSFEVIETTDIDVVGSVRADVSFSLEEKYFYKYELVSMSDQYITRKFKEGDCYLIDFSISKNIFGFLGDGPVSTITTTFEAYSTTNANYLKNNITCSAVNYCDPLQTCDKFCFGESCGANSCDVNCEINELSKTQFTCTFTFNSIVTEGTVYYRMSEEDVHYKPLHIIRVIPPSNECRLYNDKRKSEMQVCTYDKVNGLRLFLNEKARENCNCEGIEIDSQEKTCTTLLVDYKEMLGDEFTIRIERDYMIPNSFVLSTQDSQISQIKERLMMYHGELYAQLMKQEIVYTFPSDSDVTLVSKIILTHTRYDRKIEVDFSQNCTKQSNSKLECEYDLRDKLTAYDLGEYSISFIHKNCGVEFQTGLNITVQHPPIVLLSLRPKLAWLGEPETFTLTYMYYFYNSEQYHPHSITLVKVDDENIRKTVSAHLNTNETNEILFYSTQEFDFVPQGTYYIIEHYLKEDRIHKHLTILFLQHHIKIYPTNVTYYTDMPAPESVLTHFLDRPIYPEQIRSVMIPTERKYVQYEMTHANITFMFTKGLIDFTKEGEYDIVITEIDGREVSFTVFVRDRKLLSESVITINGPQPGYENTTNVVEFISNDYDLSRVTRIEFELKNEFGVIEKYTIDRNRIIESYDKNSCTLKVELYLRHNAYYKLISIHNDETNDMNNKFDYILQGFFLESHFYLVSAETNRIIYHINFYTVENAERILYIYENNKEISCLPIQGRRWIYECAHDVKKLLSTGTYADLLNVTITKDETDIKRTLQVYLIEYNINDYCVINKEPSVDVEVTLKSISEISTIRGVFKDKYFNGNGIGFDIIYNYIIKYTLPIDYTVKSYELYVQFPKFNEYYQYLIPKSTIKIVPQVFIVDVPKNTITEDNDKEGDYFDIELNEGLKEDDISRVVLKNSDPTKDDIELGNWKIMYTYEGKTVFNFVLTEKIINAKGAYYINVYDACNNLIEPADLYQVFISYELNYLTHISPRAVKVSELGKKTEFEFIYEKALNAKPTVKLVDSEGRETSYFVEFQEPFNGEGVRVPLKVYITDIAQAGLYRIKSTFPENKVTNNVDLSNLKILIYNNDVEFTQTEFAYVYKTALSKLVVPLKYPIMKEQISRVTRKVKGIKDETEITSWQLTSEKEITITFSSKLTVNNEYQIIFYLAKDSYSKIAVEIKPSMPIRFHVNRKYVYLGSDVTSFEIQVTPLYDSNLFYKDVVSITSSREELTFTEQKGTYQIKNEKAVDRRFVVTYKKLTTVILPEVIQLRYHVKNIVIDLVLGQNVIVTTEKAQFFDFGMLRKIIYKTEPFEMKLLAGQYFDDMDYAGLNSYLLYNTTKKLYLTHDTNNNKRFYLEATKLTDLHFNGLKAEIVIVENGNDSMYVSRGEIVEFSKLLEPPLVHGVCQNDGSLVGGSCQCKEGFYGQYCDKNKTAVSDFTYEFYVEAQTVFSQTMTLQNVSPSFKEDLKEYSTFVKSNSTDVSLGLQDALGEGFSELEVNGGSEAETLFLMGDLMINEFNQYSSTGTRRLASRITPEDILKKLRKTILDLEVEKVRILQLPIQDMHFDKIKATKEAFTEYQEYLKSVKSTYFEIENMKYSEEHYYLVEFGSLDKSTSMPLKVRYLHKNETDGRVLEEVEVAPDKQEGHVVFYFNLEELTKSQTVETDKSLPINTTILQEYSAKGINIYNSQDPAFNDKCYTTNPDYFDYDLTQKYRKKLYQGNTLGISNSLCEYKGLNSDGTYISFACNYQIQSEPFEVTLDFKQQELSKDAQTTHNFLALKCIGQITNVSKNIALWLFMVLAVLFVVGVVMKFKFPAIPKQKEHQTVFGTTTSHKNSETVEITSQQEIHITINKSFCDILLENLKRLHPITANCYNESKSITSIFILTICSLFGFNALYFKESYIEERIYDKSRNSFAYPFVNEASIIFASIFTTVLFTVLTKLISMVNSKAQSLIRDIICLVVCGVLILFWWIYSVGFCGMYKNTQFGWLCAGIWALLFNWIIFAPVSILIVSVLEYKLGDKKIDIVKRLFWV